ncbi:MAG: GAP family protein [Solirubrobacteraceae bacterium]
MSALILLVVSIGFADSINPSTVVPALWMAGTPCPRLASFSFGAFAIYLAGGLVLLFGPGPALISALHHIGGSVEHTVEAAGGIAVLVLAIGLWRSRHSQTVTRLPQPGCTRRSAFLLGAGIMAVELPTAFMYFGAISAVLASHPPAVAEVSLLVVYNALFVTPLLAIAAIRRLCGDRAERWLASGWERLLSFGQVLLAGITGSAGAVLLVIGVSGLLVR